MATFLLEFFRTFLKQFCLLEDSAYQSRMYSIDPERFGILFFFFKVGGLKGFSEWLLEFKIILVRLVHSV